MLMIFACIGEALISILMFSMGNKVSGIIWGALSFMHFLFVVPPAIEKLIKKMREKKHEKA